MTTGAADEFSIPLPVVSSPSDVVGQRALGLLEQHRVLVLAGTDQVIVLGGSSVWVVTATPEGVWCTCPCADRVLSAHRVAAMIAGNTGENRPNPKKRLHQCDPPATRAGWQGGDLPESGPF